MIDLHKGSKRFSQYGIEVPNPTAYNDYSIVAGIVNDEYGFRAIYTPTGQRIHCDEIMSYDNACFQIAYDYTERSKHS